MARGGAAGETARGTASLGRCRVNGLIRGIAKVFTESFSFLDKILKAARASTVGNVPHPLGSQNDSPAFTIRLPVRRVFCERR